ncbi:MAG: response regulator [Oligoflexales bacterium]
MLIIEDVPSQRKKLSNDLHRMGHKCFEAEDIPSAFALLVDEIPDCILSDIYMPNGNGLVMMDELKAKHPNIPVILISADASEETINEANQKGAAAFLTKPVDFDSLKTVVKTVLYG